jgi:hypothetical protein
MQGFILSQSGNSAGLHFTSVLDLNAGLPFNVPQKPEHIICRHNSTGTLKNDLLCMDATEKVKRQCFKSIFSTF